MERVTFHKKHSDACTPVFGRYNTRQMHGHCLLFTIVPLGNVTIDHIRTVMAIPFTNYPITLHLVSFAFVWQGKRWDE